MKKRKIKLFEEYSFLEESPDIRVYHGDNYGTTTIKPENMDLDGNWQEGVGIYFTKDLNVAQQYGDHVVYANISPDNFIDSRDLIGDYLDHDEIKNILIDLWDTDIEAMFYLISDYIEIYEPKDIEKYHIDSLADYMKNEEARNFQITLAESFGVNNLVNAWTENVYDYNGTKNEELGFYCIINPDIKLETFIT